MRITLNLATKPYADQGPAIKRLRQGMAIAAFARRHQFGFPLLSDANHAVALAYGACSGPDARYPDRVSFLIDERGAIERVYDQVDPRDHPARVLADILGV